MNLALYCCLVTQKELQDHLETFLLNTWNTSIPEEYNVIQPECIYQADYSVHTHN